MKRPNKLDWLVYRFFRWWWNPILQNNFSIAFGLANEILRWGKLLEDKKHFRSTYAGTGTPYDPVYRLRYKK